MLGDEAVLVRVGKWLFRRENMKAESRRGQRQMLAQESVGGSVLTLAEPCRDINSSLRAPFAQAESH